MTTRQAILDDLGAIMALERASFPTDAWSDAMMREELASPHSWYVVVEEAGHLVGYAGLRAAQGATDADIQTIAIARDSRGRGRGRALLTTLLAEASRRGVREVFLEVRADNPVAQGLYASEGFVEVGRRPRYYQPDDVDAVVMRLDLVGWAARPDGVRGAGSPPHPEQVFSLVQDASGQNPPVLARTPVLSDSAGAQGERSSARDATDAGACT